MISINRNDRCPCGSGRKYKQCCGLAHNGTTLPESPEALLRSRYTAYAIGDTAYLWQTTHPANEAVQGRTADQYAHETLGYCKHVNFTGLTIHEANPADAEGHPGIRFTASYQVAGQNDSFTELSRFIQVDGRWLYLSGTEVEA